MPEPDAFDPTHALDGWRPPPPAPVQALDLDALLHPGRAEPQSLLIEAQPVGFDPTHLLDGWHPPAPAPLDLELKSLLHAGSVQDEAKMARLKARGYEMLDVEDIELAEAPAPRVTVAEVWVQEIPPAPPLAEADLAPASLLEEVEQPEAAVDLPLPEEPTWPLFMEEAQVLEVGNRPPVEPEAMLAGEDIDRAGAFDAEAPVVEPQSTEGEIAVPDEVMAPVEPLAVAEVNPPDGGVEAPSNVDLPAQVEEVDRSEAPAPAVVVETPVLEPQAAEAEFVALDQAEAPVEVSAHVEGSGAPAPEGLVPPAVAEACESDDEGGLASADEVVVPMEQAESAVVELCESDGDAEDVDLPEEPAPLLVAETSAVEPLVESVAAQEVDSAQPLEDAEPFVAEQDGEAPEPEASVLSVAVEEVEPPVLELAPAAEDAAPVEAVPPVGVEAPALDFRTPPPELPPFIGDIHLPPAAPPAEVEAPVLDFRAAPPPPEPDPLSVIASIELPKVAPPPTVVEMPELDIASLVPHPPEPNPRLLAHWKAGAWTALARQVAGASEELLQTSDGLRVESHAPQWLCAVWSSQAEDAPLGRWPELASLVAAESMADALQQLLPELPEEARLWSTDLEADWDLVAELVLHQDTGLRAAQARALRELAEAERSARLARFSEGYALQGRVARRRA